MFRRLAAAVAASALATPRIVPSAVALATAADTKQGVSLFTLFATASPCQEVRAPASQDVINRRDGQSHLISAVPHAARSGFGATPVLLDKRRIRSNYRMKHFGNIWHGPRNFPYAFSKRHAVRYRMKKHKALKRWKFKRYKLAAVANMPVGKKLRLMFVPNIKSGASASKKNDADLGAGSASTVDTLANATGAKAATLQPGRTKPRLGPKSKYVH